MHAVILAGGRGMRLSEHTHDKPKALVEIGGIPIIEHIMTHLIRDGFDQITIAAGYKAEQLKTYLDRNKSRGTQAQVVDTGLTAQSAGRIGMLASLLQGQSFLLCFCDGLSDVNLSEMWSAHLNNECAVTVCAVHPPARFGELIIDENNMVSCFTEKPYPAKSWINGGYFVIDPAAMSEITRESMSLEYELLPLLASKNQLGAYCHHGFWQCMDTQSERDALHELQISGQAPWPQSSHPRSP